ncbi:MAG: DNA translocase FtsK [Dehalococcoidia bacterium]|nr:cell division protein FtsK [Chloroflexota bacterium]MDP6055593.1 DNA translocase FtsK [Dehalococcoidia bacterium]MDP7261336.1 DNA translocase FtsK [Dehalococcoidia bacterium]MDP7484443.1 DNA translocase FtsK [Dehalococcoidia bacterium]
MTSRSKTPKSQAGKSGPNAAVKYGRFVGSTAKVIGRLLVAAPAQFWFAVATSAIAAVAYFRFQDESEKLVGWSAIPLGLWLVATLFLVIFNRSQLFSRWRWVLSSLSLAAAVSGGLGIFYAPGTAFSGETYGGDVGMAISRLPLEWDRFDVAITDYAIAWIRVAALLIIAFGVASPKWAKLIGSELVKAVAFVYAILATGVQTLYRKFENWRYERSQMKELQKADLAEYEADQAAQSVIDAENEAVALAAVQSAGESPAATDSESVVSDEPQEDSELAKAKSIEDASGDSATPVTEAFPTDAEVEEAEHAGVPLPDYSAAHRFRWQLPNPDMLAIAKPGGITQEEIAATSRRVEESLGQFGIDVSVDQVRQGPTVTMYGLSPGWKGRSEENTGQRVRVDTILNREKDIALALASPNLRFEAPVPGESVVGIEVPNAHPTQVTLRSVMDSPEWKVFAESAALPVPLGLGSGGEPVMADLSRMPHTLVAGSTGSGKSVCMNSIITGLIMTKTPLDLRLIMIDPKRVELTPYQGIPHLYHPVIVEADRAVIVLRSLVDEMMGRFRQLEQAGVKNISSYNEKQDAKMPYLVILVDELADLMLTAAGDVERLLVRLAQLGRATGVHLVVATQRPSVDVVTGLIKANFPSRISFAVMSQIDSRTILDSVGAEKLLGRGDMLYMPIDKPKPSRVQGAFLNDHEIEGVVSSWQNMNGPALPELVVSFDDAGADNGTSSSAADGDSLFDQAANLAQSQQTLSVSLLQRRLRIGYPRAARLMDELEDEGVVGAGEPGKPRPVL